MTLLFFTDTALQAQEHNGIGLFLGASNFETTYSDSGEVFVPGGGTFGGIDYQISMGSMMSFNILKTEEGYSNVDIQTHSDVKYLKLEQLSLGLKYWIDNIFIGVHFGGCKATAVNDLSTFSLELSSFVPCNGIQLGWEGEDWFVLYFQVQAKEMEFDDETKIDMKGDSLSLGYRW